MVSCTTTNRFDTTAVPATKPTRNDTSPVNNHAGSQITIAPAIGRPGDRRGDRVLAAGVSFTDAQLRAGTYLPGAPKPPFTPGYELVGVVEELGPERSRLRVGDRIGALTVWGADADRVCVPESGAVASR